MGEWKSYLQKVAGEADAFEAGLKKIVPLLDDSAILLARYAGSKPSSQTKTKKASSYEESFRKLAAFLRALYQHHQFMHWRTRGTPFYGDHLLFQRLYEKVAEELDGLAEKAIGITNNPNVIEPQENAASAAEILKSFQQTPQGALDAEKQFVALITEVKEGLGNKLTDGLDNFLQGMADVHEGHVYLLQQRVAKEGTKEAGIGRELLREAAGPAIWGLGGGALGAATGGITGAVEGEPGHRLRDMGRGALSGGAAGLGAGLLGHAGARLLGMIPHPVATIGALGAAATPIITAPALGAVAAHRQLHPQVRSQEKTSAASKAKQASLDKALGCLYVQYGPPLQKHAAATFFNYSTQKDLLDEEALGKPFCKIAKVSNIDPWAMACRVVKSYPNLVKTASRAPSPAQELASFYISWSNEMLKKAGLLDVGIRGVRAAKAGISAAMPRSGRSMMNQAIKAVETGAEIPQRQGVMQAVKGSLAQTKALQQAGGGSIRRGEQLVKSDPGLLQGQRPPLWAPQPGAGAGAAGAKAPAPAAATANTGAATAGAKPPVTDTTPKQPSQWGNYLRGAAVLGGLGGVGGLMMSTPQEYGESYA